jgi:diguanylate cyclase (GGDEF)-like protein
MNFAAFLSETMGRGIRDTAMSMSIIIAGYALSLLATIIACSAIVRSKHAGHSLWWLIGALFSALVGLLLFAGRPYIPLLFAVVLANEAILISFALLHQAIAAILESPRRYVELSILLAVAQFLAFLYFTYTLPDVRGRILVRTTAILVQVMASALALFQHKNVALRDPIRVVGSVLLAVGLLQIFRLVATVLSTPLPNPLHPDPVQASFAHFNYILGLGSCFGVVWLALCAQRHDLQIMATTDGLSGLMNRRAFDEVLERELRCRERRHEPVALLLIDLDHFKAINDEYGHQVGDEVIRRVSQLLCINTRAVDAVARYGGEEFAMILKGMQLHQAESIAERLRTQIEAMAGLPEPIQVTVSIGIAMKGEDDTVRSLLKRSDEALYLSKRSGRNRVSTRYAYEES